jgi:hypothetical protein
MPNETWEFVLFDNLTTTLGNVLFNVKLNGCGSTLKKFKIKTKKQKEKKRKENPLPSHAGPVQFALQTQTPEEVQLPCKQRSQVRPEF